ncbi:MAG: hypothetical protein IPL73_14115 [Candidatus Obscuribacter sp.]|nr:hypothetical protein [Candidatus Obscuribacter sp.]
MKSDDANELPANKPWIYLVPALFFAALLAVWWLLDHNYPLWDAGSHFQDAINYAKLIRHPHLLRGDFWQHFLTVSFNYPLTQHLIYGFAKYLFGYGRLSDALVNISYLLVLSFSIATILKMARASNLAAALALPIVNCYPWVALFSHTQMLDFGHITLSALAFYAMIKWSLCADPDQHTAYGSGSGSRGNSKTSSNGISGGAMLATLDRCHQSQKQNTNNTNAPDRSVSSDRLATMGNTKQRDTDRLEKLLLSSGHSKQ